MSMKTVENISFDNFLSNWMWEILAECAASPHLSPLAHIQTYKNCNPTRYSTSVSFRTDLNLQHTISYDSVITVENLFFHIVPLKEKLQLQLIKGSRQARVSQNLLSQ